MQQEAQLMSGGPERVCTIPDRQENESLETRRPATLDYAALRAIAAYGACTRCVRILSLCFRLQAYSGHYGGYMNGHEAAIDQAEMAARGIMSGSQSRGEHCNSTQANLSQLSLSLLGTCRQIAESAYSFWCCPGRGFFLFMEHMHAGVPSSFYSNTITSGGGGRSGPARYERAPYRYSEQRYSSGAYANSMHQEVRSPKAFQLKRLQADAPVGS